MTPAVIRATRVDDLAVMLGYDERPEEVAPIDVKSIPTIEPARRHRSAPRSEQSEANTSDPV